MSEFTTPPADTSDRPFIHCVICHTDALTPHDQKAFDQTSRMCWDCHRIITVYGDAGAIKHKIQRAGRCGYCHDC